MVDKRLKKDLKKIKEQGKKGRKFGGKGKGELHAFIEVSLKEYISME